MAQPGLSPAVQAEAALRRDFSTYPLILNACGLKVFQFERATKEKLIELFITAYVDARRELTGDRCLAYLQTRGRGVEPPQVGLEA